MLREKKLLASSEDYGKDLTGVQNLRRKHQRLETEIHNHEPKVLVSMFSLNVWFIDFDNKQLN